MDERPISLGQVARRYYPEETSLSTITRHITKGVRVAGVVVKLEAHRIGGRWVTTESAVERFQALCTQRAGGAVKLSATKEHERAEAYLDSLGM